MSGSLHDPCSFSWKIKNQTIPIGVRPLVMGILNVTPDSFYDGGKYFQPRQAVERALQLEKEGADLIDVGGLSTRPGSIPVPWEEEAQRVTPVIREISSQVKIPISVDTYRACVARLAIEAGAHIVNDVSALHDPEMTTVVRNSGAGLILMHMRGEPLTMQENVFYHSLLEDILEYLKERLDLAGHEGIDRDQILVDPGIGFGKSAQQNLEIIRGLEFLKVLQRPILVGTSRKSFIGKILENTADERLWGTLASIAGALYHGASVVRVHDVQETVEFIKVWDTIEHKF